MPADLSPPVPLLSLFGVPTLRAERATEFLPERRFQLLVQLALRSGQWVSRDEVASLLWPDRSSAEARRNLRKVLHSARLVPGAEGVEATDHRLRWAVATDLQSFDAARRERNFQQAYALARPAALVGIDDHENKALTGWLAAERERLRRAWHEAALDWLLACPDTDGRASIAQAVLQEDPLDETATSVLLAEQLQRGRVTAARGLFEDYSARLAADLGVEPSRALRDLLPSTEASATPPRVAAAPVEAGGFIGRRAEIKQLLALLERADTKLVTVLGPGGIGKSSLARLAAAEIGRLYPGGVHWVELQDLMRIELVVPRLAQVLGVELRDLTDPVAQLAPQIAGKRLLVIFDNAEHLPALPTLVAELVSAAPALTLLLTSRVRMSLPAEVLLPLDGLPVPDPDSRDFEAARAFDSVRLFDLRASAAQRGFSLAQHVDAVVDIVQAVAGMPLAIELAATWVRLLPPAEIAAALSESLDVLDHDPSAQATLARPEHGSMRVVIERSWQLLSPRERGAMQALSVFAGGFTRAAARAVADVPLALLSALVDKSFVKVDDSGRFGLHPLIAAFASATADPATLARHRSLHVEFIAESLAQVVAGQVINHHGLALIFSTEGANCRRAWSDAVSTRQVGHLVRMVLAWRRHFVMSGRFAEGSRHFLDALDIAAAAGDKIAVAELSATLAWLSCCQQDTVRAVDLATTALATAETMEQPRLACDCLMTIGACALYHGHWPQARASFERALSIATDHGFRREAASALNNLGLVALRTADYDMGRDCLTRAMAIQQEIGDHTSATRAMLNLGELEMARGNWPAAQGTLEGALRYATLHEVDALAAYIAFMLGATLIELAMLEAASDRLAQAEKRALAAHNETLALKARYYMARVRALRGETTEGLGQLLDAARLAHDRRWTSDLPYMAVFISEILALQGQLATSAHILRSILSAAFADSSVITLAQAVLNRQGQHAAATAGADVPFERVQQILVTSRTGEEIVTRLQPTSANALG